MSELPVDASPLPSDLASSFPSQIGWDCYPFTDTGNAQRLIKRHGKKLRYCKAWKTWLTWDGRRWKRDETGAVLRYAKHTARAMFRDASKINDSGKSDKAMKHARQSENEAKIRAMVSLASTEPGVPVAPEELDASPYLLTCSNGTLDLTTGELYGHRPEDLITNLAPVEYDSNAQCPIFERFLGQVMGRDEKLVRYLQRVIGYALTGAVSEKAIFFLYGSGNNGKTTFLEAIRHVMGDYASQIPIESLMSKANEGISNDIARLKGRRFVTSSEAEQGRKLAESKVKQLTGMGKIQARFLFQEYFEFDAEFKIFMDSNHKPEIRGTDEAIWSRIKLIPFAVSIPASDIDKQLSKKLRSEAAGILAWAVRGCLEWQAAGGLDEPEAVKAAVKGYREEMDTAAEFLEEHCLFGPDNEVASGEIYKAYEIWCEQENKHALKPKAFGAALRQCNLAPCKIHGNRGWRGVALK